MLKKRFKKRLWCSRDVWYVSRLVNRNVPLRQRGALTQHEERGTEGRRSAERRGTRAERRNRDSGSGQKRPLSGHPRVAAAECVPSASRKPASHPHADAAPVPRPQPRRRQCVNNSAATTRREPGPGVETKPGGQAATAASRRRKTPGRTPGGRRGGACAVRRTRRIPRPHADATPRAATRPAPTWPGSGRGCTA